MDDLSSESTNSIQTPVEPPPNPIQPTKPEPWHKRTWRRIVKNPNGTFFVGLGVFFLIGLTVTIASFRGSQDVRTKATTHIAKVSILPSTTSLPANGTLQIWTTVDSPLTFANIEVTYDPQIIKLTQEAILTTSTWGRIIQQTTMTNANTTGKFTLVVGLDPLHIQTPPTGTFQLATLQFGANTTSPNITTSVSLASASQMVAADTTLFTVTSAGSTVTVNPLPTPTPTASVTPAPTTAPTSSASPTPSPNDTVLPLVTITTPADGSTVPTKGSMSIRVTASDASGIAKITIAIDGTINKTCTSALSCQTNIAVNKLSSGSHTITATATDNSTNKNTASSTIRVTK